MSSKARRLAKAVLARRKELDVSQLDVWQAGGPSNTKLTEIENGRTENLTRVTARRLDTGLQWEPGSAKRVWEGGEPTPLISTRVPPADARLLREQIEAAAEIDDRTREELLRILDERSAG